MWIDERRKRMFKLAFFGTAALTIAYTIFLFNPLQRLIDYQLTIREGTFLFALWKNPPLDVFVSLYIFNMTNSGEFLNGTHARPLLNEIGPFVFRESVRHENYTFHANGTLSYNPLRQITFVPERSVSDPNATYVVVPNIPYLGVISAASEMSIFATMAASTLVNTLSPQPVLNMSVHDYLWGYHDRLFKLATNFVPKLKHFDKFGILNLMFNDGHNSVSINLPPVAVGGDRREMENKQQQQQQPFEESPMSESLRSNGLFDEYDVVATDNNVAVNPIPINDYSIDNYNRDGGLTDWGYQNDPLSKSNTACNTLRGAFDGTLFPRDTVSGQVLRVYRKVFCRTLPVQMVRTGTMQGIDAKWFTIPDNAFDSNMNDPNTSCFCTRRCLKKGLANITPCYYNIPAAISLPHFHKADPSLLAAVDGLKPNPLLHESEIVLQSQLGIPMKVTSKVQVNLLVGSTAFNIKAKSFTNTVVPLFWAEIKMDSLPNWLIILLNLALNILPHVQTGIGLAMAVTAIVLFGLLSAMFFHTPPRQNGHIRYAAVSVLPALKRELSRYSDRCGDETRRDYF